MHVLFDAAIKPEGCTAPGLYAWLAEAPGKFDMVPITAPQVFGKAPNFKGIIVLAESHIAVHIEGQLAFIDVFTCKLIDLSKARQIIEELPVSLLSMRVIERGLEFIDSAGG